MPQKYNYRFAKVHGLQYSVPVQSEVIKRKRQTLRRVLNTFVSKIMSANFDIFPGSFWVRKSIVPVPSFLYNS